MYVSSLLFDTHSQRLAPVVSRLAQSSVGAVVNWLAKIESSVTKHLLRLGIEVEGVFFKIGTGYYIINISLVE